MWRQVDMSNFLVQMANSEIIIFRNTPVPLKFPCCRWVPSSETWLHVHNGSRSPRLTCPVSCSQTLLLMARIPAAGTKEMSSSYFLEELLVPPSLYLGLSFFCNYYILSFSLLGLPSSTFRAVFGLGLELSVLSPISGPDRYPQSPIRGPGRE